MKITNHHELRNEVLLDCSTPIMTDQSFKNQCDINVIMANYAKTGLLSHTITTPPRYIDNSSIPSLEDAFRIVYAAEEAFSELPPDIRRLMDNDPSNLENFVSDPKNRNILQENGLILLRQPTDTLPKESITTPKE